MSVLARDTWFESVGRPREPIFPGEKLWLLPVAAALLAPLITWLPMLAHRYGLGLPKYEPARGIDIWHMQVLWALVFAVVALIVGRGDRWLGWGTAYLGLGVLLWGGAADITNRVVLLGSFLILWAVRQTPVAWAPMVKTLLAASGIFQAAYIAQQILGYDLLWGPLVGGVLKPQLQPIGTLGTVDAAACYVAITAPLMPVWALPLAIGVVLKGHSMTAITALGVGLLIRLYVFLRETKPRRVALTVVLAILAVLLLAWAHWYMPPHVPEVVKGKVGIWGFGLSDWAASHPVWGPGPWAARIPALQMQKNYRPTGEVFMEAHNEYLQGLYEFGAAGMLLTALWAWRHRRAFTGALAPSLWTLSVSAGGFFVFHVVSVALVGVILLGLATADSSQEVVA